MVLIRTTFDVTICDFRIAGDETKVQVDSTNTEGFTALHYACWHGHQKVAQLLKEAKADPRARYGGNVFYTVLVDIKYTECEV